MCTMGRFMFWTLCIIQLFSPTVRDTLALLGLWWTWQHIREKTEAETERE